MSPERRHLDCQLVRDLAWVVSSPSLIIPLAGEEVPDLPALDSARLDPEDLRSFLVHAPAHRVGHYFERLVLYYLTNIRRFDILAAGLQVQEEKQTIGEVDFVFRDPGGQLHHWETAVKFYLHLPEGSSAASHWIGPNPADTFERKIERMFDHQLPLSRRCFPAVTVRSALVRGRIFYHRARSSPAALPERLSPQHLRGSWIYRSELDWLEFFPAAAKFRALEKPFWLSCEVCTSDDPSLLSIGELQDALRRHFARSDRAQLLSVLAPADDLFREIDRVFVVDDRWPQ